MLPFKDSNILIFKIKSKETQNLIANLAVKIQWMTAVSLNGLGLNLQFCPRINSNYVLICIKQTSYRYLTGKIWKDSKYCRKNKSAGVRKTFLLPTPKAPLPFRGKKSRKKGRRRVQAPRETSLWNTQTTDAIWHSMHGQESLKTRVHQSTHKQGNKENLETTETIWSLQSFHQHRWG